MAAKTVDSGRKLSFTQNLFSQIALLLLSAIFLVPLVWLMTSALKTDEQIFKFPPEWIPSPLVWENFPKGLAFIPFWKYLTNTLVICTLSVFGTLLSCSLVAYGLQDFIARKNHLDAYP